MYNPPLDKNGKIVNSFIFLFVCFMAGSQAEASSPAWPATFEQWVQQRVGPVIYPTDPKAKNGWNELLDLDHKLGSRAVKTWIGEARPGDIVANLKAPHYRRLIQEYRVVHFNVCLNYVAAGYQGHADRIDPGILEQAKEEWREITKEICRQSQDTNQIVLLSCGGELNVYLGTAKAQPDFPVADYVNAAHQGKAAALNDLANQPHPQIYTVAELQGEVEYEKYARRWVPQFQSDLISLSYYTFFRSARDSLSFLRSCTPARGPFGADRLMLGEYGPTLESCNWNQASQARWHYDILRQAYEQKAQFAFYYSFADDPGVIRASGHDGLVGFSEQGTPYCRQSWFIHHALLSGQPAVLPDYELYEAHHSAKSWPVGPEGPNLAVESPRMLGTTCHPGDRLDFAVTVRNDGPETTRYVMMNFFVNDRIIAYASVPALKAGAHCTVQCTKDDGRFLWTASPGEHWLTVQLNSLHEVAERAYEDNTATLHFTISAQ